MWAGLGSLELPEDPFLPLPDSVGHSNLNLLWLISPSHQSPCPSVHRPLPGVSVTVLLLRTLAIGLGITLIQNNLILTNYPCRNPVSKQGHILRFQADRTSVDGAWLFYCIPFCQPPTVTRASLVLPGLENLKTFRRQTDS